MSGPGHHPPPDFSCPPPNMFQPYPHLQQPGASGSHPGMWDWQETPSETNWGYNYNYEDAESYGEGPQSAWDYGTYGQSYIHGGHRSNPYCLGRRHYWRKKTKKKKILYTCAPCDRGYKCAADYEEHMSQHVKCADCSYEAHEKLMKMHRKYAHAPGSKQTDLDALEEIAKWREERRKNYPTRENAVKKQKETKMSEGTDPSIPKTCSEQNAKTCDT